MEPTTAIAVAQAGYQLYSMFKSGGGGGMAKLLQAQARMLNEISEQITVTNKKLDLVIARLDDLRDIVHKLPDATSRETIRMLLNSSILQASNNLKTLGAMSETMGFERASYEYDTTLLLSLNNLQLYSGALRGSESEAVIPIVATAWYVEMQLLLSRHDLNLPELDTQARSYKAAFDRWISGSVEPRLANAVHALNLQHEAITASGRYRSDRGYIYTERVTRVAGSALHDDGVSVSEYKYTLRWTHHKLSAADHPKNKLLAVYQAELNHLRGLGIEIPPNALSIEPLFWSQVVDSGTKEGINWRERRPREIAEKKRYLDAHRLATPPAPVDNFLASENSRFEDVESNIGVLLVNLHLRQVAQMALSSIDSTLSLISSAPR